MMKFSHLFVILLLMITSMCTAQPQMEDDMPVELTNILQSECFQHASVGLAVYNLTSSAYEFLYNADLSLTPASTLKIWTTAAALAVLGPTYRFVSEVGYSGKISGDTLYGDLIIKGSGDPSLASNHLQNDALEKLLVSIAEILQASDIRVITGAVIGDASAIPKQTLPRTWPYQDLGNYYGSHCTGLNVVDNLFEIRFQQNQNQGELVPIAEIRPSVPRLELVSYVTTGPAGSGDQAYVMGAPFQTERLIVGTIPPGSGIFRIKGSLPDPANFLAHHLHQFLKGGGYTISNGYTSNYAPIDYLTILGAIRSDANVYALCDFTNKKSINLFAEGLGHHLAKEMNGEEHPLLDYWSGCKIAVDGCKVYDYSGLSPENTLTARAMIEVLAEINRHPEEYIDFKKTLAQAGVSGTLSNMWKNSPAQGKIWAKSGSISGVLNYAGYMESKSGKNLAFCLFTQHADCINGSTRRKLEQVLEIVHLSY
ncbi:MAG: D-alanyl-D-alanine carboxypeptidase/D-alanyl-D-alanine-endopeptidase [Saprospiraceae bacterium]|nr:D-alanyl-D-alanine carboxypeptidase/D-alanyl-D-alanine-endopeptidase [Saprospiraceae bacterium]